MNDDTIQNNDGYEGLVSQKDDGLNHLSLFVDGVYCAACIQKIETSLKKFSLVKDVRLNFSTGRLNVSWDGSSIAANDYVHEIETLGYSVQPYNPNSERILDEDLNRFLLLCIGVAGFAMGNIMLLSIGLWSTDMETMGEGTRGFLHWIAALIAIPAVLFSGRPFFRSAFSVLRRGHTNMDVPISLALILATSMSLFETINNGEHVYFDSAVMLTFFLLIGRYLDFKARNNAKGAAKELMQSMAGFASIIEKGRIKKILISDIKEGMTIKIAAGEKVPVDSIVLKGKSTIDTSLITGETIPKTISRNDKVFAGTINHSSPLVIKAIKIAENSILADIIELMEKAEQAQANYVRLADRVAKMYTPVVHVLAALAFVLWFFFIGASWQVSLLISVTVLIITCPCALALAVPVVQVLATSLLMKKGVLVKSGDALERLSKINKIYFDKTGTLTKGQPQLIGEYDMKDLQLAASLASHSNHPLSRSISKSFDGKILTLKNIKEYPGKGLQGNYRNKVIRLGSVSWCGDANKSNENFMKLCLSIDEKNKTYFLFKDELKDNALESIEALKKTNLDITILSGDRKAVVNSIAKELSIDKSYADQTPLDKHKKLQKSKSQGQKILMVGDGLNDAPVLAAANVSIAPGSALDIAQNAADIIVMGDDLKTIPDTYDISVKTQKLVHENFMIATIYNCIAIPLAFAGFVTPMIAAIAMSGSSLLVILNSYRLK